METNEDETREKGNASTPRRAPPLLSLTVAYASPLQAVYSRVARICKSDRGGPNKYKRGWTTYLKSRLNCSLPGEYPFYFDHLRK